MDNKIPMMFECLTQGGFMILVQLLIPVIFFPFYIIMAITVMSKLPIWPAGTNIAFSSHNDRLPI